MDRFHYFQAQQNQQRPSSALRSLPGGLTRFPPEPRPVECNLCHRRFKNIPALNGHMRLHGGYFKKVRKPKSYADWICQRDRFKWETSDSIFRRLKIRRQKRKSRPAHLCRPLRYRWELWLKKKSSVEELHRKVLFVFQFILYFQNPQMLNK